MASSEGTATPKQPAGELRDAFRGVSFLINCAEGIIFMTYAEINWVAI